MTGPIFLTNTQVKAIGASRVRVPDAFYKVLYSERDPPRMIGFVLPHQGSDAPLHTFATNVAAVESLTGLNFFSVLPDAVETNLEAGVSILLMRDLHSP